MTRSKGASDPGRLWSFANVAEAAPLTMTPLCWTFWQIGAELGVRDAYHSLGILPAADVRIPDDPNERITQSFYGRQAINVDLLSRLSR